MWLEMELHEKAGKLMCRDVGMFRRGSAQTFNGYSRESRSRCKGSQFEGLNGLNLCVAGPPKIRKSAPLETHQRHQTQRETERAEVVEKKSPERRSDDVPLLAPHSRHSINNATRQTTWNKQHEHTGRRGKTTQAIYTFQAESDAFQREASKTSVARSSRAIRAAVQAIHASET
jgi:hypothetical protein